ncbi:MAG: phosphatase PAP2 family protein [Gemmatimonadales bacterium]
MTTPIRYLPSIPIVLLLATACSTEPTEADRDLLQPAAAKAGPPLATTTWNERTRTLLVRRPPANGQAAASRIFTYLSLAQYRAAIAAENGHQGPVRPSVKGAVGAAAAVVLSAFFPLDAAEIASQLAGDLAALPRGQRDDGAGEAIGRTVGSAVVAQSAGDNYLVVSPGVPPVGPGYWVSSGAAIVRSLHGARPFFLTSPDQLRPAAPPAFGTPEFLAALAEVRAISDTRTAEQLALAQFWNTSTGPFTAGAINKIASDLIARLQRDERKAARLLAYANAAAFDAQIACFDAKFAYWFIRPSQADPAITLPIGLPNHPSYPSAHSCITAAILTVVSEAFPERGAMLADIIAAAGMSRIFGGIHYRFDIDAGQAIGSGAAALALAGSLE